MSLKLEFCPDLNDTFFNVEEFGMTREFLFMEDGVEKIVTTKCVWDTESLKTRTIVQQQGVFLGTVLCFIHKNIFKVEPKPEQIIYSPCQPFRIGWRIVDITDAEECYELYLDKLIA
jgi:hypothetical protein